MEVIDNSRVNFIFIYPLLGTSLYLWPGVAPKRDYFFRTFFLTQLNFVSKIFLPIQLKPIIFLYPTNYTFFIQLVYQKMVRGVDSVEVASSKRR